MFKKLSTAVKGVVNEIGGNVSAAGGKKTKTVAKTHLILQLHQKTHLILHLHHLQQQKAHLILYLHLFHPKQGLLIVVQHRKQGWHFLVVD